MKWVEGMRVRATWSNDDTAEGTVRYNGRWILTFGPRNDKYMGWSPFVLLDDDDVKFDVLSIPKPKEPQNIGAVVQAWSFGFPNFVRRFVLVESADGTLRWMGSAGVVRWHELADVIILHEGYKE